MGLNPCFNGFTSLTYYIKNKKRLLEEGLNPCFNGFTSLTELMCNILDTFTTESQSLF